MPRKKLSSLRRGAILQKFHAERKRLKLEKLNLASRAIESLEAKDTKSVLLHAKIGNQEHGMHRQEKVVHRLGQNGNKEGRNNTQQETFRKNNTVDEVMGKLKSAFAAGDERLLSKLRAVLSAVSFGQDGQKSLPLLLEKLVRTAMDSNDDKQSRTSMSSRVLPFDFNMSSGGDIGTCQERIYKYSGSFHRPNNIKILQKPGCSLFCRCGCHHAKKRIPKIWSLSLTRTTVVSITPAPIAVKFPPADSFVCGTVLCAKTKQLLANMTRYFSVWRRNLPRNFHCVTSLQIVSAVTGVSSRSLSRYQKEFTQNKKMSNYGRVGSVLPACKQEASLESKKLKLKAVKTSPFVIADITDQVARLCETAEKNANEHSYVKIKDRLESPVKDVIKRFVESGNKDEALPPKRAQDNGEISCESNFFCDEVYDEFEDMG